MQHARAMFVVLAAAALLAAGCSADAATDDPPGTAGATSAPAPAATDGPAPDTPALKAIGEGTTIITPDGEYRLSGAVLEEYHEVGGQAGPLGMPTSDEVDAPNGGRVSTFEHGAIYWMPETGAHAVWGDIRDAWEREGGAGGRLGYPTSDERMVPGGRERDFQNGTIRYVHGVAQVQDR